MLSNFLLPESVTQQDGASPVLDIDIAPRSPILITLGITRIIEQESLNLSIWGSTDGEAWGSAPLLVFPQKFYCGTYSMLLTLSAHPEVRHLRAQWKVHRWGRGETTPMFGLYIFAQEASARAAVA